MFAQLECNRDVLRRAARWIARSAATAMLLLPAGQAWAQTDYLTFTGVYSTVNVTGLQVPSAVSGDSSGNLFITDFTLASVIKLAPDGTQTTLGNNLSAPEGVAVDASGTVYVTSHDDSKVYKISSGGTQTSLGSGWNQPVSIAVDSSANVYVTDAAGLSKVTAGGTQTLLQASGSISGVAVDAHDNIYYGPSLPGFLYEIPANTTTPVQQTSVEYVQGLYVDPSGNVYMAETDAGVHRSDDASGDNTVFGDTSTSNGVWGDGKGNLYIADGSGLVEKIAIGPVDFGSVNVCPTGTTVTPCGSSQTLHFALDNDVSTIMTMSSVTQGLSGIDYSFSADGCSGSVNYGSSCSVTVSFNPLVPGQRAGAVQAVGASYYNSVSRPAGQQPKIHAPVRPRDQPQGTLLSQVPLHGIGLSPVGLFSTAPIQTDPDFSPLPNGYPAGLTLRADGALLVTDSNNCVVQLVTSTTTTVAGSICGSASGDGGPATSATFANPARTVIDGAGNLYISDSSARNVRIVNALSGDIATFAGTGQQGNTGDGGAATQATFQSPNALALDQVGDLFIADGRANVVRRVDAVTGIITTIAGNGTAGYSGDSGQATSAELHLPDALAMDSAGNLIIADDQNNVIRKVAIDTGIITTIAGNGTGGYSGDGGPATSAMLYDPEGVSVDAAGNLYIADSSNFVIRMVNVASGNITTVAGKYNDGGSQTYSGENGPAVQATLGYLQDVAAAEGYVILTDSDNNAVRGVIGEVGLSLFGTVALGASSAAQDSKFINTGNTPLLLGGPILPVDFTLGGADTTCAANLALAPGESCILGIELAPVTDGALQEAVLIPNNTQNQPGYGSPVILVGTGTGALPAMLAFAGTIAPIAPGGNLGTVAVDVESSNAALTGATSLVTLTITGPGGYAHTLTVAAVNGVATFNLSGLPLNTGGLYSLSATSPNLIGAQTTAVVSGGNLATPAQLAIPTPPPATLANGGNLGAVAVDIENYLGTVLPGATNSVTLTLTGPGGYTHSVTVAAANGVANFNLAGLSLTTPGVYTLTATSDGLVQAVATLTVKTAPPAPPGQLAIATSSIPATLASGGNLGVLPVEVLSGSGVVNTSASNLITLTIIGPGGFDYTVTVAADKGIASFDLSALPFTGPGVYTVSASAGGLVSVVRTFTVTIDFTIALTGSTPGTENVPPGSATGYNFTLAPASGSFASPITLTAAGLPAGATYVFSPATVTPGSTSVTTQLSIQTARSGSALLDRRPAIPSSGSLATAALALLLLPLAVSRRMRNAFRRGPWLCVLLLLSLGAVAGLSGCGAGGLFGQPQQTYTITVTGTSGSISHSATVTLTVQ